MMTKDGRYPRSFAAALTASAAVIGPIIPPSIPMVLYALVSDASIGYLFLGGICPGLLMGVPDDHRLVMSRRNGTSRSRNRCRCGRSRA
jgi:C4-dicarboxylate transporter, DctM subunit